MMGEMELVLEENKYLTNKVMILTRALAMIREDLEAMVDHPPHRLSNAVVDSLKRGREEDSEDEEEPPRKKVWKGKERARD